MLRARRRYDCLAAPATAPEETLAVLMQQAVAAAGQHEPAVSAGNEAEGHQLQPEGGIGVVGPWRLPGHQRIRRATRLNKSALPWLVA